MLDNRVVEIYTFFNFVIIFVNWDIVFIRDRKSRQFHYYTLNKI